MKSDSITGVPSETILGENMDMEGTLRFENTVRIRSRFKGRIFSSKGTLIIDPGARIDADIHVGNAIVSGTVNGAVVAGEKLVIHRQARIGGNIQVPLLSIEDGAIVNGSCTMDTQGRLLEESVKKVEPDADSTGTAADTPVKSPGKAVSGEPERAGALQKNL